MMPNTIRNSGSATSANSTSAWPRSSRLRPRRRPRSRGSPSEGGSIMGSSLRGPSATRTFLRLALQIRDDLAEDPVDAAAEGVQGRNRGDRDERQDQRVLHEGLPFLAVAERRQRQVHPDGKRLERLHVHASFRDLPRSRALPVRGSTSRFSPPVVAHTTDRPCARGPLLLEGWVRSGPSSRLEIERDLAED